MQFVGKFTEVHFNEARENSRSGTYRPATGFGAVAKLVVRWWAVLMAVASTVAVSLVAALSVGCYGVSILLAKVRPLGGAYQVLSRAYDRVIDRLGQRVLRDPRDTPALRIMVSLSLTTVPIFLIQLVLGNLGSCSPSLSIFPSTVSSFSAL